MDWRLVSCGFLVLLPLTHAWYAVTNGAAAGRIERKNEVSPYIDLVFCPIRDEPWSCARQQSARILDVWDGELQSQWQKLKVEADRQLNATIEKRGYSASEDLIKEKPSTILKKIEIGTKFMKEYLAETMDGFLGREYGYVTENTKQHNNNNIDEDDTDADDDEESDDAAANAENESEDAAPTNHDDDERDEDEEDSTKDSAVGAADASNGVEFIEIEESAISNVNNNNNNENDEGNSLGQVKKGGGGGGGNKRKRKKKPANVLVVQPLEHQEVQAHGHGHGHGGKPQKQKKKRKKPVDEATVVIEQEPSDHFDLGVLDELLGAVDIGDGGHGHGGKRKQKPSKYGRSNGVTRGKKKKKKKALQKLILLGSFLKAKIELLLKILGAHLQIKFFAIALIGLLINIARFWIDVKRGGAPQKVVYVEHAHHQHHYEDHGGDDWGEQGSYWKRSLQTDPTIEEEGGHAATDSYQPVPQQDAAHYMAYRNQWQ